MVQNLMFFKITKYACTYALIKVQIYFKNMHISIFTQRFDKFKYYKLHT